MMSLRPFLVVGMVALDRLYHRFGDEHVRVLAHGSNLPEEWVVRLNRL